MKKESKKFKRITDMLPTMIITGFLLFLMAVPVNEIIIKKSGSKIEKIMNKKVSKNAQSKSLPTLCEEFLKLEKIYLEQNEDKIPFSNKSLNLCRDIKEIADYMKQRSVKIHIGTRLYKRILRYQTFRIGAMRSKYLLS